MTKIYFGGCACGAIRFETSSEPISRATVNVVIARSEVAPGMDPI